MQSSPTQNTMPLYDSDAGKSAADTVPQSSAPNSIINEVELVRSLYSKISSALYPYVKEVLDSYDYFGSPIYDNDGISRETLAQLVSMVLDTAEKHLDEVGEIMLEESSANTDWSKNRLLHAVVEVIILNNIFMYRRPRMRIIYDRYSFKDGKYTGMNYT
jgi:hypothetical protein